MTQSGNKEEKITMKKSKHGLRLKLGTDGLGIRTRDFRNGKTQKKLCLFRRSGPNVFLRLNSEYY
jgi:hypothetical protein